MDHIPPKDMLQISFKLYRILGERFDDCASNTSPKLTTFRWFTSSVLILNVFLAIGSFGQAKGELYMKSLEASVSILHTWIKYMYILYYKEDIRNLLCDMKYFWNSQRCAPNVHKKITNRHRIVYKCIKWMVMGPICVCTLFCLRPVFNTKNKFIFYIWTPWNSEFLDTLMLLSQYYFTIFMTPIVFGCDFFYVSYSIHIALQVYILNRELENLQDINCVTDISECVRHHQLLLSIFQRMKKIFFWLLLFHYFGSLLSGCSQMYMIMLGKSKAVDLVTTGLYFIFLMVQFAYYSFPVELIVSELQYTSIAVYTSQWFKMNIIRRRLLLLMMMKAQRQTYLSIGGIMDMNVDAFGSVVRKVFSFCAILRNVLNK